MSENKKPRTPKPKGDLSALFPNREHEEAFHLWARDNTERLKAFNENADAIKSLLYAVSEFWYDRVNQGWKDTLDLLSEQGKLIEKLQAEIPEAVKRGKLAATLANWDAIRAVQERSKSLAMGRSLGAKSQQEYAEETNGLIQSINNDLLNHPTTARWGLEKRAHYIEDQLIKKDRKQPNGKPYKASTIKTKITGKG